MKNKERQQFEPEFKARIVKLILSKEKKISELARELKINENTLHVWKRKYFAESAKSIQASEEQLIDAKELKNLFKDLASVKEENEILKKALGIFSRQM